MSDNFSYNTRKGWYPKPYTAYSSIDITVSGSTNDHNIRDNTIFFSKLQSPNEVLIRNGSEPISVKFNSVDNDIVNLVAYDFFQVAGLTIHNIYITVSGSTDATFNMFTLGWF
jgi:hypothetical protein